MKTIRETEHILVYEGKDEAQEIAIKVSAQACFNWGGLSVCDFCNEISELLFLCPELGHNALCKKCFKEHTKDVVWHIEDTYPVVNSLLTFAVYYKLTFTELEYDIIDEFLHNKGQNDIHIRKVIKSFKGDDNK